VAEKAFHAEAVVTLTKLEAWLIAGVVLLVLALVGGAVWHHDVMKEGEAKCQAESAAAVLTQVKENAADAERRTAANEAIIHDLQTKLAAPVVAPGVIVGRLCSAAASSAGSVPKAPSSPPVANGAAAGESRAGTPLNGTNADDYVLSCRRDAIRLGAFQDWARKQGLPVE
jgi:hypothetical protein